MRPATSFFQRFLQLHWPIILLVLGIGGFGFAMMVSAAGGEFAPLAIPQMLKFTLAFGIMLVIAMLPIEWLLHHAYTAYLVCLAVLVAVEIAGFAGKGAQRWVDLGVFNLQPSEIMKVALVLALARYFHNLHPDDVSRLKRLGPALLMVAIPALFILRQPNLGTTIILLSVAGIMFFMAGVRWWYFAIVGGAGVAAAPLLWHFMHDYQKQRVLTFLDPQQDPLGAGYNILQSIIAIGSGGFYGKGYMQGSQGQLNFLPEKHTDFIFTMVGEEFGFLGSVCLIITYGLVLLYGLIVAMNSRSLFGALLASGVVAMLFVHICINMGMVMALLPVVGVPLPLLSYGGSITVTMLVGFGLLLNAHTHRATNLPRERF